MNYPLDKDFLLETLQQLVRINSVNPSLVPGAPGELDIAHYIHQTLSDLTILSEVDLLQPKRANVVGKIAGKGGGRSLMLNAHMDTVGVEGMDDPFSAHIKAGRLYGRGAQDMKASIAAMLTVAKGLVEAGIQLKGDLLLTFVADEEYASIGAREIAKKYKTDAAIVTEPTGLDVCIAHKGFGIFELITQGRAAHGSRFREGMDANTKMGKVLTKLERLSNQLQQKKGSPLLGPASMHIPLIRGGDELFIYASQCSIMIERRVLPGEVSDQILSDLQGIIEDLKKEDPLFEATLEKKLWRPPYEISHEAEVVQVLTSSAEYILGKTPAFIGHHWWEDSAVFAEAGMETVIFGPTGDGLHSAEEWVEIDSVIKMAKVLMETVIRWCGVQ